MTQHELLAQAKAIAAAAIARGALTPPPPATETPQMIAQRRRARGPLSDEDKRRMQAGRAKARETLRLNRLAARTPHSIASPA